MKLDTKFTLPKNSEKYKFTEREFAIVNSCNGLLCLCKSPNTDPSVVCNPITGEYIAIPKPEKANNQESAVTSGFGFSPRTNQYKVLRMEYRLSEENLQTLYNTAVGQIGRMTIRRVAEVYTLGTASWRCIGYAPNSPCRSLLATFLNGAIHWSCDNSSTSNFIVAFDFDDEEFRIVPPPPHFGMEQKRDVYKRTMGELRGCLCLSDVASYDHFDIWVMKDYGVPESWTKEFVISLHSGNLFQPIKCLNNGDTLMVYDEKALVSYNQVKKSFRYLEIHGVVSDYEAIVHTPSLVLLKDILMGDNLEVQNVKSRCADSELSEEAETPFLVECKPRGLRFVSWMDDIKVDYVVAGY